MPTGAGLGGGSSDAGTLLRYLGQNFSIEKETLFQLALKSGADIPFFLQNKTRLVGGIGDILENIEVGAGLGVLCCPGVMANTQIAYQDLNRPLQTGNPP